MIDKGVLRCYYVDDYYGRKLTMEPTTARATNIIFKKGAKGLEELIAGVKKGILVSNFIGGNSNSTTGDFSIGITGELVENGKLIRPVNEMNITGNSREFWHRLTLLGNDPYLYSPYQCPSMLFEALSFSGS